jgi:SNF2-related domain/SNF2 Helicase protein/Helicase conserved C-terminal domain
MVASDVQPAVRTPGALAFAVSPSGRPRVAPAEADEDALDGDRAAAVAAAFERGAGAGVLHLGAVEVGTSLPAAFGFFRTLGHELVARLCARTDLESLRGRVRVDPPADWLAALAAGAPPMRGAEYVTAEALEAVWREAGEAFAAEVSSWKGPVTEWLHAKNAAWATVGRVVFHLAENKRDPERPFAFLATYTARLSAKGAAQHRPLGHAVEESGAARDREQLLALLLPVQRAAEKSALVRALVDSGDVYHPLAWTAREAYAFLKEMPVLEGAGVSVRVPDWWTPRAPPRAQVVVRVGGQSPGKLSADAVLDFTASLAIDGEPLSDAERRAILQATEGLVLIRGRWVEADGARLGEVLGHWQQVERAAKRDGIPFHEALRLVAGASLDQDAVSALPEAAREWSRVEAGPWMKGVLDGLRASDAADGGNAPAAGRGADPGDDLKAVLRPYQRDGVRWLWWAHELGLGVCLADDMGLGKTLQVLALLLLRRRSPARAPALLIVPASLVANWTSEAARFAPSLRIRVVHGAAPEDVTLEETDAVVTTYGTVTRSAWLREREWGLVVLDEAQAIKNPGARQTRAAKAVKARARVALTGTPVENRLGDLWSLFDFLQPGLLGGAKEFGSAARRMAAREQDGYRPLRRLLGPYLLRRLKTDRRVIADLPDKTEVTAFCALTRVQAVLYQRAVDDLANVLEEREGIQRRGAILASLLRLKQICNHPSHFLGDGAWTPDGSGKLARLREIAEAALARQEKMLVFSQFREMCGPLASFLAGVFGREGLVLHGSVPVAQRKGLVDAFQAESGPPFFVLSLKAGGTGLNLTAASHVVHYDRWWNPAVENQATDRAFRIGQKKNVVVHKFVCRGTVEERIDALMASKRALAESVVESEGEIRLTELKDEELMRLVSLDLGSALGEEA